jgi:hypothetical protein
VDAFFERLEDERRLIRCQPHAGRWESFSKSHELEWQSIPFRRGGGAGLPKASGLYCFIIGNSWPNLPAVMFPLYAGETLNLRQRYNDYVREKDSRHGRFTIRKFLTAFSGETTFTFAPLDAEKDELMRVEKRLNDALMPPYSRRDHSAEVKEAKAAWQ